MGQIRISVLIVASEDSGSLRDCLRRVRDQSRRLDAELVLVLNQTPTETSSASARALRDLADLVEHEPCVGKSNGLNRGVGVCRGDVVAFSDDDGLPRSGWLEAITRPLLEPDRPPQLVGCGGPVRPIFPEGAPRWYRKLVGDKRKHFLGPKHDLGREPFDYLAPEAAQGPDEHRVGLPLGVNCAYRREIFEKYRFDPDLGPNRVTGLRGGEDTVLGLRLLHDGYRLQYRPDAIVEHPVQRERTTLDYVRRSYFVNGVEEIRLRRSLGQPLPTEGELLARLNRRRRRRLWRRILDPAGTVRRELKFAWADGMLAELGRQQPEAHLHGASPSNIRGAV